MKTMSRADLAALGEQLRQKEKKRVSKGNISRNPQLQETTLFPATQRGKLLFFSDIAEKRIYKKSFVRMKIPYRVSKF